MDPASAMAEEACAQHDVQHVRKHWTCLARYGLCHALMTHQICYRHSLACVAVASEVCGGRNDDAAPEKSGNQRLQTDSIDRTCK